jgi:hypothetical protein
MNARASNVFSSSKSMARTEAQTRDFALAERRRTIKEYQGLDPKKDQRLQELMAEEVALAEQSVLADKAAEVARTKMLKASQDLTLFRIGLDLARTSLEGDLVSSAPPIIRQSIAQLRTRRQRACEIRIEFIPAHVPSAAPERLAAAKAYEEVMQHLHGIDRAISQEIALELTAVDHDEAVAQIEIIERAIPPLD